MKIKNKGAFYAILSSIIGSIATVFASGGSKTIHPLLFASIGAIIGATLIFIISRLKEKLEIRKSFNKFPKDFIKLSLFRSVIGHPLLIYGISLTTAVKAVFLTRLEPLFVLIWSYLLLNEKIDLKSGLALGSLLVGAFLLSTSGDISVFSTAQIGDILIIISLGFLSYTYFISAKLSKNVGAKVTNIISTLIGGLVILPIALYLYPTNFSLVPLKGWAFFSGYIILWYVVALTLWFGALKTVKGWKVSALRAIGPIVGAIFAFMLFGDTLNSIQIIGAGIILVSSFFLSTNSK